MLKTEEEVRQKIAAIPQEHGLDPAAWADYEEIDALEEQYWREFRQYVQRQARGSAPAPSPQAAPPAWRRQPAPPAAASQHAQSHPKSSDRTRRRRSKSNQRSWARTTKTDVTTPVPKRGAQTKEGSSRRHQWRKRPPLSSSSSVGPPSSSIPPSDPR